MTPGTDPAKMSDEELERDREVIAAASPEPWYVAIAPAGTMGAIEPFACRVIGHGPRFVELDHLTAIAADDMRFMARARTRWPLAIAEIERLRSAMEDEGSTMRLSGKPEDDQVYYRLYLNTKDEPCVVCCQNFDEDDYVDDRWLTSDRFTEQEEAIDALVPWRLAWLSGKK